MGTLSKIAAAPTKEAAMRVIHPLYGVAVPKDTKPVTVGKAVKRAVKNV